MVSFNFRTSPIEARCSEQELGPLHFKVLQFRIKLNMSQPTDPENDFIEFAQVWGGRFNEYLEGVIMYESKNGSKYILRHISNDFGAVFFFNKHCFEPL